MNEVIFKQSYKTNKVAKDVFQKQTNGACLTLEYTVNGNEVRFIVVCMETDYCNRKTRTTMIKEVRDELGNWNRAGAEIVMHVNDDFFVDTTTGDSVHYSQAYEYVDDTENPIEGTDPVEYPKLKQLKANLINEVDFMVQSNSQLFAILEEQGKTKVEKLYE